MYSYFYFIFRIFLFTILVWLAGFVWFFGQIPEKLNYKGTDSDAIVVLTGGSGRLDAGVNLLSNEGAQKLLISGVGENTGIDDLRRRLPKEVADKMQRLANDITLGHLAHDTDGNAKEAKIWMEKNNLKSLILVTSNYHMPRSVAEFKSLMPHFKIISYPVFSKLVKVDKWWDSPGTLKLIFSEYNKYLVSLMK